MRRIAIFLCALVGLALSGPAQAKFLADSKYFSLYSAFVPLKPETLSDRATVAEAQRVGQMMDLILERYRAFGFPEPLVSHSRSGRYIVHLLRYDDPLEGGTYAVKSEGWLSDATYHIRLNVEQLRRRPAKFPHTAAHEMFHALQAAFTFGAQMMKDEREGGGEYGLVRHDWVIEGTADAAAFFAADGIAGFRPDPGLFSGDNIMQMTLAGGRRYSGPLHMDPPSSFPRFPYPSWDARQSYVNQTYWTSGFWRFLATETTGLPAFREILRGDLGSAVTPDRIIQQVHINIQRLYGKGGRKRFPGGLPQAYAEFIAEQADLPFITRYGTFSKTYPNFDEETWTAITFGKPGRDHCEVIELGGKAAAVSARVSIDRFASTCFRVVVKGAAPSAFDINVVAASGADEEYACQAVGLGSNGVTLKRNLARSMTGSVASCRLSAPITFAPRSNMTHQSVVVTNVHAQGGNGPVRGTRPVDLHVHFVLGAASATGQMAPSPQSSSVPPPPPAPGAPVAAPSGASTGKNVSINSTSARARGRQARNATPRQISDCGTSPDSCPQIEIDLGQYDERFETITAMGNRLGGGALVALDGAVRQIDVSGIFGNAEDLGAMAMELADTEFTEVALRFRAPDGRIEQGMVWDDALVTALVGTMAGDENVDMHSRGPLPQQDACRSQPPATGRVRIDDVGEGWIRGAFSADLFENYVHEVGKDPCAARPATGQVSGDFTARYEDITQQPVDPSLAAYQVWAGLPAAGWGAVDYDALVQQAVATQRELLEEWDATRGPSGAGGGVGGPVPAACAQECFPGVMGCPNISPEEAERLTPIYLRTLPAAMRDLMRQQLEKAPPEARSRLLATGMDLKGCMEGPGQP
ncbi:hypothetical protein [Mesorhizobium sp. CAU 1741]|uniref:hypothetical protein n=1 Tax=Mesorhizobium sp. CAU 1741 TaxID=3140366 RepID=UPI00325B7056